MNVVLADVEDDALRAATQSVTERGGNAIGVHTDVSQPDALVELASRALDAFGAVHLLCNNAGVLVYQPVASASLEDWQWVLSVNLYGVVHGLRAFVPRLRAQGGEAHIVNTGSISGLAPFPQLPTTVGPYIASKYAVVGLTEMLRTELEPDGIGVSVLCPGGVDTRIGEAGRNRPGQYGGPSTAGRPAAAGDGARLWRRDPADVARLVLDGVRANRLYIHTDPAVRKVVEQRFERLLADFDVLD